jgi:RNase P protein component
MRAAAASVLPALGQPGTDYVLIARAGTADRPFSELMGDLEAALRRIGRGRAQRPSALIAEAAPRADEGPGQASLSHEAAAEAH